MKKMLAISAAALSAAGCSALRSTPVDFADTGAGVREGLHYSAPKGMFYVELLEIRGDLSLRVSEPVYYGDPNASFMLEGAASTFAHEDYVLAVHPRSRLLQSVYSESEGQAGQILTNLVRSAAAIAGADGEPTSGAEGSARGTTARPRVIFRRIVDPFESESCNFGSDCAFTNLNGEMHAAALAFFSCAQPKEADADLCRRLNRDSNFLSLRMDPLFDVGAAAAMTQATPDQCRRAICYRIPAPYALNLRIAGVTDQSEVVLMPNEGPIMSLAVPAGVFATSRVRINMMANGMPANYTIDRRNELVAVTLMPFTLVSEGFKAIGEVFTFRINYNNQRIRQLESEARREDAEDAARARNAINNQQTAVARREGDPPPGAAPATTALMDTEALSTTEEPAPPTIWLFDNVPLDAEALETPPDSNTGEEEDDEHPIGQQP